MKYWRAGMLRAADERLGPDQPIAYWFYQISVQHYAFASRFASGKDVLDIGCGTGYGPGYLARKGARTVVGGDIDPGAIKYGRSRFPQARFLCADAARLPFQDESFDIVTCFELIEHLVDFRSLLSECRRILRHGGTLICSTPNRDTHFAVSRSPHHVHEFSAPELQNELSDHYAQVALFGQHFLGADKVRRHRWEVMASTLVSVLLSYVPLGRHIKQILARSIAPESRRIPFDDNFEETLDAYYEVTPLDSRPGQTPTTLVAVARRQAQRG